MFSESVHVDRIGRWRIPRRRASDVESSLSSNGSCLCEIFFCSSRSSSKRAGWLPSRQQSRRSALSRSMTQYRRLRKAELVSAGGWRWQRECNELEVVPVFARTCCSVAWLPHLHACCICTEVLRSDWWSWCCCWGCTRDSRPLANTAAPVTVASLGWVTRGAATEGVTPLFFPEKPGDLFCSSLLL